MGMALGAGTAKVRGKSVSLKGQNYITGISITANTISILLLCIKCYDIWHYEKSYAQHQRIA